MNKNSNLNKKIILCVNEKDKKICKILIYIAFVLLLFILVFSNFCMKNNLTQKLLFNANSIILILLIININLSIKNTQIEINNSAITKVNLFKKKEQIGNISEITSFSASNHNVTVLKNNEEFFSFNIHGNNDNIEFYDYLKRNYKDTVFINGSKITSIIIYIFSITIFMLLTIMELQKYEFIFFIIPIILLIYGLDERLKMFQITNEQIIYKRLFINKKININDLTELEYKKITGYGRYKTYFKTYSVTGFINKSKCFKINNTTEKNIDTIKDITKPYKIKMIKK